MMKYKVRLLETKLPENVTLSQLGKMVLPRASSFAKNLYSLAPSTILDDNKEEVKAESPFGLMRILLLKKLVDVSIMDKLRNIKHTKGFGTDKEVVDYYISTDEDVKTILDYFVFNQAPKEEISKETSNVQKQKTFGPEGNTANIHKKVYKPT